MKERICSGYCHGIINLDTGTYFKTPVGRRRRYFCSESCAKHYAEKLAKRQSKNKSFQIGYAQAFLSRLIEVKR